MSPIQKPMPVPDAWKAGGLSYARGLTLAKAKRMLNAAENEAKRMGLLMCVSIADSGGNLIAMHRMDNAMLCGVNISMDKAYTAVYGKIPTVAWGDPFRSGELPPLFFHERWTPFPGGFPLIKEGKLYGGLGLSGATMHGDMSVARAAISTGGFSTADVDALLKEMGG